MNDRIDRRGPPKDGTAGRDEDFQCRPISVESKGMYQEKTMFPHKNTIIRVALASLLLIACGIGLFFGTFSLADERVAKESKIKDLLRERLSIFQEIASLTAKGHRDGQLSSAEVREANLAVHAAELDLCDTSAERTAVLEKILAEAKDYEQIVARQVASGLEPTSASLHAKVSRLDAEIAIERADGQDRAR